MTAGVVMLGLAALVAAITYAVDTYLARRRPQAWVAWESGPTVEGPFREPPPPDNTFGVDLWE